MNLSQLSPDSLLAVDLNEIESAAPCWTSGAAPQRAARPVMLRSGLVPPLKPGRQVEGFVEMYGGAGVGANAGGVRCANVGALQFKGIGSSPLAGRTTDKWHRHGAMSLQDAVKEALMGELFHAAAPFGAIRCLAIYDLQTRFATEIGVDKTPSSAPQAVIAREVPVRVAHFMRSSFLNAGDELAAQDVKRMRSGVPRLVNHLLAGAPVPSTTLNPVAIVTALEKLYTRLLTQDAALRTKRLVHGSLIPSNICLDGRMLDFTTATAVSTLHPVFVSPGGYPSDEQHLQMLESLDDLLFYIFKYEPRLNAARAELLQYGSTLRQRLLNTHRDRLMQEHLHLLGFSPSELSLLPNEVKSSLLGTMADLVMAGDRSRQLYFGGDEHAMRSQGGRNDVFAAVAWAIFDARGLALVQTPDYAPEPTAFNAALLARLKAAYGAALQCLQHLKGSGRDSRKSTARLCRAMQRHADLSPLYRRTLDGAIHEAVEAGHDLQAFVDGMVGQWAPVFHTPADGSISLQGWLTADDWTISDALDFHCGEARMNAADIGGAELATDCRPRHRWLRDAARALN